MPEDSLINDIMTKYNQAQADLRTKRDNWLEMYRLYRNYNKATATGDRSNIGIPLAFEWVEVVLSRLFDVFGRRRPYIRAKGREPQDDSPAQSVEMYQNYQYDLAGYKKLLYDVLHQILIFGTGITKVHWKYEEGKRIVYKPILADMPWAGSIPSKEMVPIYDNVAFELVDVFDFAVDNVATLEEAEWCAHQTIRSVEYLQEMGRLKRYQNIGRVLDELSRNGDVPPDDQEKQEIALIEGHIPTHMMGKKVKLLEYFTDDEIVTIVNGKHIVRHGDNPYHCKPFVVGKIIGTPHEFYGISLIEAGAQLSSVVSDVTNNILDNQNHAINKLIGVDELRVDDTELVSRPWGFIHTRGTPREALYEFPFSDIGPSGYNIINMMNEFAKRVTGVVDYIVGQGAAGKTATEAQLMTNEAAKRIGMHIAVFGDTFVGPLAKLVHKMNRLFQVDEKVFRVTGLKETTYEMVRITPDVFGAEVDFMWEHSDRELNNMVARQEMTQLLSIASTNPILMGFIPTLFVKMLETYDLHKNDRLMQAAQLAEAMVPLMQQAAAMQGMSAGGGGMPNAEKFTGGSEGNVSQSLNRQANPTYGSITNVK